MQFYDVLEQRRSIRGYAETAVEPEKLQRLWRAVQIAPTACNRQPFQLLVAQSPSQRQILCSAYKQPWFCQAPILIAALGSRSQAWQRFDGTSAHNIDVAIVMQQLVLAATAEGLGTCWICAFDQVKLHAALALDPDWEVVAMTPLGYPAAAAIPAAAITHKPINQLIRIV